MVNTKSEWNLYLSEAIGTALLLFFGLSVVIFSWGDGSIIAKHIPNLSLRRALTGFLFGTVGCLVTISPVGKISGAHINPVVSLAFLLRGKMRISTAIGYMIAQMIGAAVGSIPLLLWGKLGASVQYGMTLPGEAGMGMAFGGEVVTTACLIFYLYIFIGTKKLRNFTPFGIPFLYCLLVWSETVYSGCSTNPARSFGPALIMGNFSDYWLYWIAPIVGVFVVTLFFWLLRLHHIYHIEAARLSYHERKKLTSINRL